MGLLPWLCDVASEVMDIFFGPRVSIRTLVDKWLMGSNSLRRRRSVKGALHKTRAVKFYHKTQLHSHN